MPAKFDLTWDSKNSRWRIQYNGKRFVVSCRQLDAPPTKEGSYQAANAWWKTKVVELESSAKVEHPHARQIETVNRRIRWATEHGQSDLATGMEKNLETLVEDRKGDLTGVVEQFVTPSHTAAVVWEERLAADEEAVPIQTVEHHVERRLSILQKRVLASGLTPGSFANTRDCLYHFRDWLGAKSDPKKVNADTLEDFHGFLLGKIAERRADPKGKEGWSVDFSKKVFGNAKAFITYLAGKGVIALPTNINSREFKFGSTAKKIITMTKEEVTLLTSKATGQLRLHLLLMLNCGMTQTDIADIQDSEVDWKKGRITRKRSKTADQDSTPIVSYKLWAQTFDLLKQHRSGGEDGIVLKTTTGGLWAWEELGPDGKLKSSDNVATNYKRLRLKLKIAKSLKIFRKTSATMLESSPEFRHFRPLFLGHAAADIGEKHYADHSSEYFDNAVAWLGQQYGF